MRLLIASVFVCVLHLSAHGLVHQGPSPTPFENDSFLARFVKFLVEATYKIPESMMYELVKNSYHPPSFAHLEGSRILQSRPDTTPTTPHDGFNTASQHDNSVADQLAHLLSQQLMHMPTPLHTVQSNPFQLPYSMPTPQYSMPSASHLPQFNPAPLHLIPFAPLSHIPSAPHMLHGTHTLQTHADTTSHDGTDTANAHENLLNGAADAIMHSMLVQPLMHNPMPFNPTALHSMLFNPAPQTHPLHMRYSPSLPQMQFQPQSPIQPELESQHNSAVRKSPTMQKGNIFLRRRRANSDSKLLLKSQSPQNPSFLSELLDIPAKMQPEHNSTLLSKIQPNLDLPQNNTDSSSNPSTPVSTHLIHSHLSNGTHDSPNPETHDSSSTNHGNNNNSTAPITAVPVLVAHELVPKATNGTEVHVPASTAMKPELNPAAAADSQSTNKTIAAHVPKFVPRRRATIASYQPTTYQAYEPEQIGYVVIIIRALFNLKFE